MPFNQTQGSYSTGGLTTVPFVFVATRDPTANDINFPIGQRWINQSTDVEWTLFQFSSSTGVVQADWQSIGGKAGDVNTLTGNSGGAVSPDANGNINVLGDTTTINITGNPATNTLTANVIANVFATSSLSPYIVGTTGLSDYSTIQAAINAAVLAGASSSNPRNIYIKPKNGFYTENPVLADGINLVGFGGFSANGTIQPQIKGKITFSGAGTASVSGLGLNTNSDYLLEITGASSVTVNVDSCYLNGSNNNSIHCSNASASILLLDCTGNSSSNAFFISTGGDIVANYCNLVGSGTNTFNGGNFFGTYCVVECPFSSASPASMAFQYCIGECTNATCITFGDVGSHLIHNCIFESGTASTISIGLNAVVPIMQSCFQSSNVNVITGAGTMQYAFLSFFGPSSGTNVATRTPLATLV